MSGKKLTWNFYKDKIDSGLLLVSDHAPNTVARITFQGGFKKDIDQIMVQIVSGLNSKITTGGNK